MDTKEAIAKITEQFGSRESFLGYTLVTLSMSGQPCDITFYKKPLLDVTVHERLSLALAYGAGAKKLQDMLSNIKVSDGSTVNLMEVWTVNPMPKSGISEEDLKAVDLAKGDEKVGPHGETLRKMISDTYHCKTKEEEDHFLRRFIAS